MDNLEDEVCSPKSLDMKEEIVEHMVLMATCKVRPEIEVNTFDCAIVSSLGREYGEKPEICSTILGKSYHRDTGEAWRL